MPEQYRRGEKLRITLDGVIEYDRDGDQPGRTAELTIAVSTGAGLYDVTVPLDYVTVERLVPAEGEPVPGEVWQDKIGRSWFAYVGRYDQVQLVAAVGGDGKTWLSVHQQHGPLTRVYPPPAAPEPPAAHGMAAPELRVGDVFLDSEGDEWRVVSDGVLRCPVDDLTFAWAEVVEKYGPLTRVETPAEQAPAVPELRVGDVWADRDGDLWRAEQKNERLILVSYEGYDSRSWEKANEKFGPLARVETRTGGAV